ncbi:MAG TPA: hypothetical protein VHE30_11025, partial [Polyangiaceae bacterium]|nr:hypothetical protein [Polyangiaceae bacterium]
GGGAEGGAGGGGGAATGGSSGAGTGGEAPDGSTPDGSTPNDSGSAMDANSSAPCITVQATNPTWCHSGKLIEAACPAGRVVTTLTRCDGSKFENAASYASTQKLSACEDTGCSNDGNHTIWRAVECCYPSADSGTDAN